MKSAAAPKAAVPSSPGRAEKLPARGLARLLFNKSCTRSRRGPRSGPMFASRTKSLGRSSSSSMDPAALPAATDPSSPKVTCIGQVRIRKKSRTVDNDVIASKRSVGSQGCRCLERALLCKFFSRGKGERNEKAPPPAVAFAREIKKGASGSEDEDDEGETKGFAISASSTDKKASELAATPPKNALLLMRCRSAPHNRSSALSLCRFAVSPVPASPSEEGERDKEELGGGRMVDEGGRESCNGSSRDDDDQESRCSTTTIQQPPAGLMRCKSEPAKKAEKLMAERNGVLSGCEEGIVQGVGPTPSPPHVTFPLK